MFFRASVGFGCSEKGINIQCAVIMFCSPKWKMSVAISMEQATALATEYRVCKQPIISCCSLWFQGIAFVLLCAREIFRVYGVRNPCTYSQANENVNCSRSMAPNLRSFAICIRHVSRKRIRKLASNSQNTPMRSCDAMYTCHGLGGYRDHMRSNNSCCIYPGYLNLPTLVVKRLFTI